MAYLVPSGSQCCPHCKNPNYVVQVPANTLAIVSDPQLSTEELPAFMHCQNCQANFSTWGTLS